MINEWSKFEFLYKTSSPNFKRVDKRQARDYYSERDHSTDLLAVCEMLRLLLVLRSMVLPKLIVFFFFFDFAAEEIMQLLHTDRLLPRARIHIGIHAQLT